MTKKGARRPVVFPEKNQLKEDIVLTVARSMGLTRRDIEKYIAKR